MFVYAVVVTAIGKGPCEKSIRISGSHLRIVDLYFVRKILIIVNCVKGKALYGLFHGVPLIIRIRQVEFLPMGS